MRTKRHYWRRFLALTGLLSAWQVLPQGIPEPSIVFYGVVRNGNVRMTLGTVEWTVVPSGSGAPVTVSTALTNINDQFSYVLRIPCETVLGGQSASPGLIHLTSEPVAYDRSQVRVDGTPAVLVAPAPAAVSWTSLDRGRLERIDLVINAVMGDADGDGIPDAYENMFGFLNPNDPNDALLDFDNDGLNNRGEYVAGTDPDDDTSRFAFIEVEVDSVVGVRVRWSSVSGRTYALDRSEELLTGYTVLEQGIVATPGENVYHDTTADGPGPYFYRVRVEE